MEKQQLMEILQSCLLYFDGVAESELCTYMDHQNVKTGINLCNFLEEKSKGGKKDETN